MSSGSPRIALITTTKFREIHQSLFKDFVNDNILWLCSHTECWATATTYQSTIGTCETLVKESKMKEEDLKTVRSNLKQWPAQSIGIVAAAFELIEGRLVAVFHLSHYKDIHSTFASSVLKRQALVHNTVYADSVQSANFILSSWRKDIQLLKSIALSGTPNLVDLQKLKKRNNGKNNLALIAHDGKKLDLCLFAIQFLPVILKFDYILATGTTGAWLKKFFLAVSGHSTCKISSQELDEKLILCESGPKGGDVQIAHAALSGLCSTVIFFIDPMSAHPHEPDIRFLEQVVEASSDYPVTLATNAESAKHILSISP